MTITTKYLNVYKNELVDNLEDAEVEKNMTVGAVVPTVYTSDKNTNLKVVLVPACGNSAPILQFILTDDFMDQTKDDKIFRHETVLFYYEKILDVLKAIEEKTHIDMVEKCPLHIESIEDTDVIDIDAITLILEIIRESTIPVNYIVKEILAKLFIS